MTENHQKGHKNESIFQNKKNIKNTKICAMHNFQIDKNITRKKITRCKQMQIKKKITTSSVPKINKIF